MPIDKLIEKIKKTQNPSVMGLDPNLAHLPTYLKEQYFSEYGKTLQGAAEAVLAFNQALIDATCDIIPAVKPQIAYYEALGVEGLGAFHATIDYAKQKGMYVIADVKRNDIGTTAQAYAQAMLGNTELAGETVAPFGADCATVNPYLGTDGILPFVKTNKSIFVLVKTSNPSSGELQDKRFEDGKTLYETVAALVNEWGKETIGSNGYSNVGAVVGATYPEQATVLRTIMKQAYFLVPGYGAQGGTAKDVKNCFNADGLGAIVNSSRGIMCAYKKQGVPEEAFAEAARSEAIRMRDEIVSFL